LSPHLQKMKEHDMYSSTPYYTVKSKKKLPLYIKPFNGGNNRRNQLQKISNQLIK